MEAQDSVVVRTTMQPDRDLTVSMAEATDLRRQGLIVEDETPAPKTGRPTQDQNK